MEKKVIDLEIIDDLEESGVDAIALVDSPAIEKNWMFFKKEAFVEPKSGESQSDYMSRCVPTLIDEGKPQDQAVAICISTYENMSQDFVHDAFAEYPWDECMDDMAARGYDEESSKNLCGWIRANMAEEGITDYPKAASENAQRALTYAEENGWGDCGTPVGKIRANQLAKNEAISIETVARMASFERHRQNSSTPYGEGCGKLMWDAWGGDEGIAWAQKKLEEYRRQEMEINTSGLAPYTQQTPKKKRDLVQESVALEEEPVGTYGYAEEMPGLDVFGYRTRFFYICPGAQETFKHLISMPLDEETTGMVRAAALQADRVFEIEARVIQQGSATKADLKEAILLVDDFKDVMSEIDKATGMIHEIGYMDGHIETIAELVPEEVDFSKMLQFAKENGFSAGDFTSNGMEVNEIPESFNLELAKGYTVYKYVGAVGSDTRDFCREMVGLDRFYTFEEIDAMGAQAVNPGFGLGGSDTYSIWKYKGGPNCKHRWQKFYVTAEGTFQNKGAAPGIAGEKPDDMANHGYAFAEERPISRIPKSERGREGSDKNKPGDTKTSRGGIEVSEEVEKSLKEKIDEHNKKNPQDSQKADLGMLKAVWRRGAGAYSVGTPGRRGMTRNQWAMGRVNAFLKILSGSAPSDKDYSQDNDLLPKSHPKHSEEKMSRMMFADEDKRELVGPVALPDIEIPRRNRDGEVYFVRFSKEVIRRMAEKFMREQRIADNNIQHKDDMDAGSYVFESWIVENEQDKANSVYGFNVPLGTWMVKMRVANPSTWSKVKAGELNGFSLQGDFVTREQYQAYVKDKKMYEDLVRLVRTF